MAYIRTRVCDRCEQSIEDHSDGVEYFGIFCTGMLEVRINQRERSGSSSKGINDFGEGDYCSFACFEADVSEWMDQFRNFKNWRQEDGTDS